MKKRKITNFGNYYNLISRRRAFICGLKSFSISDKEMKFLRKYKPWGIILFTRNIKNLSQIQKLTSKIRKIFNDKNYPIIIDEEGGRVSRLKNIFNNSYLTPKSFGKIYDKNKKKFSIYLSIYIDQISEILNLIGVNINSVPVLDLFRKGSHKIIGDRAYSSNPKKVSLIGNAIIKRFRMNGIQTIIKHIPGHGLAKSDSHYKMPIISSNINYLKKKDFYPFKNKSAFLAMTAHILFKNLDNKYPVTHSKILINIIRRTIGFKNLIITDDISMKSLKHGLALNTKMAFNAGCNIVLHCNGNLNEMLKVAQNSPFLSKFTIKKTSQMIMKLS